MYNPIIQSIQVLKLEKRLDESLRYLRDCPLEYSTFPVDMQPELRNPDALVPINKTMVPIVFFWFHIFSYACCFKGLKCCKIIYPYTFVQIPGENQSKTVDSQMASARS